MEKEIIIGNRSFKIREILAREIEEVDPSNRKEMQKIILTKGANLSEEEYKNLTIKESLTLAAEIIELNGLANFRQTTNGANN